MARSTLDDLRMMHKDTLVRYKGDLVYIVDFISTKKVEIRKVKTQEFETVPYIEEDFDFSPVRIGFVNYRGLALYVYRSPIRQYKQGMSSGNTRACLPTNIRISSDYFNHMLREAQNEIDSLKSVSLCKSIDEPYPSLLQAVRDVSNSEEVLLRAFDKQFAVSNSLLVFYKTEVVGKVVNTNPVSIEFLPNKEYLRILL